MRYKLFLYQPAVSEAYLLNRINRAIGAEAKEHRHTGDAASYLRVFNAAAVAARIRAELTAPGELCKCTPVIRYLSANIQQLPYLYIATSYAEAAGVLTKLYMLAAENDLVLYDAETDRTFINTPADRSYLSMRIRQQALNRTIRSRMHHLWCIVPLENDSSGEIKQYSSAVVLKKSAEQSFERQSNSFCSLLEECLHEGESLHGADRCCHICGNGYRITYALEGYAKHPYKIGYPESGSAKTELLRRMGMDQAMRWMEGCTPEEAEEIRARMRLKELRLRFPNPAERFAESIRITKWQRKQAFHVRYGILGPYGAEVIFHAVPNESGVNRRTVSVLKLGDDDAVFLLPFVHDVYPDIYERFNLEENHISSQMLRRVVDRLKQAKGWLLFDPEHRQLKPYVDRFYFYLPTQQAAAAALCRDRSRIVAIFDCFIRWAEAQLRTYGDESGLMFNIMGP